MSDPFDEDAERIHDYQMGNEEAFSWLFHKYYPLVYKIFRVKSLSEADADDLTEEIFIKLIGALKTYQFDKPFKNYLHRIVRNKLIDFYRQRHKTYSYADMQNFISKPANQIDHDELREIIDRCLRKIVSLVRRSILMLWIDGYKRNQMAELLNIPLGTIHSNLERGKIVLRKCIEDKLT